MRHIQSFTNDAAIQDALDNKTLGKPYVALNNQTGEIDWDSKTPTEPKDMYFTIEAISAGTVYLALANGVNMQYSTDNGQTWETNASVNAQPGDKVLYKGINNSLREDRGNGHSRFSGSTASFVVYGNIMSLLYGDNFANQTSFPQGSSSIFEELFANCSGLTDASNLILPATTLVGSCYYRMFQVCRNLTAAPALPATAFTENVEFAYQAMFQGCSSLEIAPDLPIKVLKGYNYNSIFEGCSSLRYIKCLATSWVDDWQTLSWVNGVAATGTFVKDPSMTGWTTGINGIPSGWTVVDDPVNTEGVWLKKYDGTEISGTPENNSYRWSFDWYEDGIDQFYIIENGNYLNLDAHICGYEYGCDDGIKGGEGGWDEDNQEWIECADKTGVRIITSYPLMEVTYTPGATPALYVETYNEDCTCEEQGLCDDGEGNCIECDPCDDWENVGYGSYEECRCAEFGENCEEPEEEPEE